MRELSVFFFLTSMSQPQDLDLLQRLLTLPFGSRLHTVLFSGVLHPQFSEFVSSAMQRVPAVPSLKAATVFAGFACWEDFIQIWKGCSPNMRRVAGHPNMVHVDQNAPAEAPAIGRGAMVSGAPEKQRIQLESFSSSSSEATCRWPRDDRCPFDVSHIQALQLDHPIDRRFSECLGGLRTIEVLSTDATDIADISGFRQLAQLEVRFMSFLPAKWGLFRTILPQNRRQFKAIRFVRRLASLAEEAQVFEELEGLVFEMQDIFPQLTIVEIVAKIQPQELAAIQRDLFQRLNPRITLRWTIGGVDECAPWYTKIV
ncbi:hypothetical protein FB45DRAFT_890381 [Roridomyces roridus]|uniref:Uncharacterized protein n=1 Tax=Roridomyces roridus TaxID=1738132 RepID=A0AAD7FZV6_9AGAR|nr:hypothetical protein FB45DRAFT_890381 [Roridomyces roridus]